MKRYAILTMFLALVAMGCGRKPETGATGAAGPAGAGSADSTARMNLVLARVGDMTITVEDLRNHMLKVSNPENTDAYMKNPDIVQVALASLVDQFVWAKIAKDEGFKLTQAEQHQVAALESEYLATQYMQNVLQKKAAPTRSEVEEFYMQHQDRYLSPSRVAVRNILLGNEAEARRVAREAQTGADFANLAKLYSKDEATRDLGGTLGYVSEKSEIPGLGRNDVFAQKVLSMRPGDVDVIQTQKGWHVVKVEKREGGDLLSLDQVYDKIAEPMIRQRFGPMYNEALNEARDRVGVEYDSKNFETFTGIPNNCDRLMEMAEQAGDDITKIELYRRVSADFSDCKHAGRAQFMIGYTQLVKVGNKQAARKALMRLQNKFGNSEWRKPADYLLAHLDDDPATLGTPDEIRAKASR